MQRCHRPVQLVEQLERAIGRAADDVSSLGDWEPASTTPSPQRALRLRVVDILLKAGEGERARAHLGEILRLDEKDLAVLDGLSGRGLAGDVYELERDRDGPHGRIMKYNLNRP